MSLSFLPTWILSDITHVTPEFLKKQGITLLMMDFDNTIVPYTTNIPTEDVERWLRDMAAGEIDICVVSNSKRDRVVKFCDGYGINCITHSKKPFPKGIRQCLARYGRKPTECALVGDQIFTDTMGANCCGVTSVLVNAIDNHNIWLKLRHVAELPFIYLANNRRITK